MFDALEVLFRSPPDAATDLRTMAVRLGAAAAAGVGVAVVHRVTRRPGNGDGLTATLVLLTVLMALVTLAVGNNAARAFSLVGALSIVRFRTVVEDTRDTAFVVFAVAMGMVIGTGVWEGAVVGLPVVGLTAWAVFRWDRLAGRESAAETVVQLRLGLGADPDAVLAAVTGKLLASARLTAATTAKQGAALEVTYAVRWADGPAVVPLVQALHRCEGVQAVEVRKA
jgi:hypothetical protein